MTRVPFQTYKAKGKEVSDGMEKMVCRRRCETIAEDDMEGHIADNAPADRRLVSQNEPRSLLMLLTW